MFYSGSMYSTAVMHGFCQALADGWCWNEATQAGIFSCCCGAELLADSVCSSSEQKYVFLRLLDLSSLLEAAAGWDTGYILGFPLDATALECFFINAGGVG
ncbi:hypothetical protein Nepgr_024021 [Nepenthes gracilis]|uniref:Uncharacterized protein n=1 Tax=Nepenthes gracilis TaxID=150966 RepID=A0AAD3T3A2_NEPGR|nr:hypothetical protein Nepgr_024021 [Nepenthes gracilis]